jgi:hypothetical protein
MANQHHEVCEVCGINRFDGTFYFSTGKATTPQDVAGLICKHKGSKQGCINNCTRTDLGDSWAKRFGVNAEKFIDMGFEAIEAID